MKWFRRSIIILFTLLIVFAFAPSVSAHPLGNFTINHYSEIQVQSKGLRVLFVLDMAEIPAFQEISQLDKNQNGKADPDELVGYSDRQCNGILKQLELVKNGAPVTLTLMHSEVSFPPGAGGLSTLRLTCAFENPGVQIGIGDQINYRDNSYSERIGWREIVVTAEGVKLAGQFATTSISKQLTSYPKDKLATPLNVQQVSLQVINGADSRISNASPVNSQKTASWSAGTRSDRFTELITLQNLTPASILLALAIAFIWGGLHSLTPGHGKTIVGAYLVGSRGTAKHAVFLGLMTTFTHTAGVFLLGLVTLFASHYILPDRLFPWISVLSGLLVLIIGISLFVVRLRGTKVWRSLSHRVRKQAGADHLETGRSLAAIPVQHASHPVPGITPFSRYVAVRAAPHVHEHRSMHTHHGQMHHSHDSGDHAHTHLAHMHEDGSINTHSSLLSHTHAPGKHDHTHLPPGADGSSVTWRSLLALGVSGGLLPCPSALVVLLGAIALNRIGFGIVLVLVFSLGLAGVLTGIGLLLVYARRLFERLPVHSRAGELIPAGSALFITILGVGITLQALAQIGWF